MRELSLFTGAGGGLLGSIILGWRTVAAVEIDAYCQRVLCARGGYMADAERGELGKFHVARWQSEGVSGAGGAGRERFPVYGDIRTFDGTAWRGKVDIVTGGFPCQPFSQAGKRLGEDDPRNMWSHAVRVLVESGAPLGFFENVPGLLSSGYFGTVLGDLAEAGFDAEWCVLGADDVGAPHRRKRLWILAYRQDVHVPRPVRGRDSSGRSKAQAGDSGAGPWWVDPADVPDAECGRRRRALCEMQEHGPASQAGRATCDAAIEAGEAVGDASPQRLEGSEDADRLHGTPGCDWPAEPCGGCNRASTDEWLAQPYVGRVAHGVASRVDRLRALGNGQVPLTMAAAFTYLARQAGILR